MRKTFTATVCLQVIINVLKECKEVTDLRDPGRLFQSEGALNLKVRLPLSLEMFGTVKKGYSVCLSL